MEEKVGTSRYSGAAGRRRFFPIELAARGAGIDEIADNADKRLMLGSRLASTEKVTDLDFSRRSAGRHVCLVQIVLQKSQNAVGLNFR